MITDKELQNMDKAVKEIGSGKTCVTAQVISETKKILLAKGYDAAELYAAQLTGTDENTELMRVINILRKYNLGPDAGVQILDKLGAIESGKW